MKQRISRNTGSEDVNQVCSEWLSECLENHELCKNVKPPGSRELNKTTSSIEGRTALCERVTSKSLYLPTRLVELQPHPRICTSEGLDPTPYCTLSHCWGDGSMLQLRTENIDKYGKELPLRLVPKTFLDAFQVARRLGFNYIWIDSLCIIQDSQDDWEKEAVMMRQEYGNSIVNISAAGSTNGNGGLFFDRREQIVQGCYFSIEIRWPDLYSIQRSRDKLRRIAMSIKSSNAPRKYYEIFPSLNRSFNHHVLESPLCPRAWVVQEHFLSKRNIHFGTGEIFWECGQQLISASSWASLRLKDQNLSMYIPSLKRAASEPSTNRYGLWTAIIEQYPKCAMTCPKDSTSLEIFFVFFENLSEAKQKSRTTLSRNLLEPTLRVCQIVSSCHLPS
jgi:hypothetical protein